MTASFSTPQRQVFTVALVGFIGAILFSVAGTVVLTTAPDQAASALGWIYQHVGLSIVDLVKGPTWVYMALLPVVTFALYLPLLGWRTSIAVLVWASVVGAAVELLGTQTGVPFGSYEYTGLLGAKIAGHVPWLIPPSWYAMALLSFDLARRLRLGPAATVGATALFMVMWDVALDPAMTAGAHSGWAFWTFEGGGIYFGMPLVNWAGWLLTAAIIAAGISHLVGDRIVERKWAPALWSINVLFPVFILFAYGAALAGLLGLAAMAIPLVLVYLAGGHLLPGRPRNAPAAEVPT